MERPAAGDDPDATKGRPVIPRRVAAAAIVVLMVLQGNVHAEQYHYSITGRVRPLLLFWISRSGVGDAVVTRDRTKEHARYSLLIGSDPIARPDASTAGAYIEEEIQGAEAHLVGLMTQSDEESLEEADANVRTQAAGRHPFKAIQETVNSDYARSLVTTIARQRITRTASCRPRSTLRSATHPPESHACFVCRLARGQDFWRRSPRRCTRRQQLRSATCTRPSV